MRNSKTKKSSKTEACSLDRQFMEMIEDIKQQIAAELEREANVMRHINTFGAFEQNVIRQIEKNIVVRVGQLDSLVDYCLHLCYLLQPIKKALKVEDAQPDHPIKLIELVRVIRSGRFYTFLQSTLPKCVVNNRTTITNVEILLAGLLTFATNKLNLEQIKNAVQIFSLQERQNQIQGVILDVPVIMSLLKHINKTISHQSLKTWIGKNKFQRGCLIMPHQFLYLACQCIDRDTYFRKIQRMRAKSSQESQNKNSKSKPVRQPPRIPDYQIQQQFMLNQNIVETKHQRQQPIYKLVAPANKMQKGLSKMKRLLREESLYKNIKKCLAGSEKTDQIKRCIETVKPHALKKSRQFSSVSALSPQVDYCKNTFITTDSFPHPKLAIKGGVFRQPRRTRPSTSIGTNNLSFRKMYQGELSSFDMNSLNIHNLQITDMLL